mmetsp:Transcript_12060/g.26850  ORF Transcript_12060/g.26850 Transcript_12060/m.26850 type:complete len:222 (-) Transcript_12060:1507-2172(-)
MSESRVTKSARSAFKKSRSASMSCLVRSIFFNSNWVAKPKSRLPASRDSTLRSVPRPSPLDLASSPAGCLVASSHKDRAWLKAASLADTAAWSSDARTSLSWARASAAFLAPSNSSRSSVRIFVRSSLASMAASSSLTVVSNWVLPAVTSSMACCATISSDVSASLSCSKATTLLDVDVSRRCSSSRSCFSFRLALADVDLSRLSSFCKASTRLSLDPWTR